MLNNTNHSRIKKNEYHIPSRVGPLAKNLIQRLLQHEPNKRPSVADILQDDFMTMGYLPARLPVSCLTMAPRFNEKTNVVARRTPLLEVNGGENVNVGGMARKDSTKSNGTPDCYLGDLYTQLKGLIASKPGKYYIVV